MVPKVEGPWDIHYVDRLLAQLEARPAWTARSSSRDLETALGVTNLEAIAAASPRMQGMSFGPPTWPPRARMKTRAWAAGTPATRHLRPDPDDPRPRASAQQDLWHYSIGRMVDACAATGILPFYGPFGDIKDVAGCEAQFPRRVPDGLRRACRCTRCRSTSPRRSSAPTRRGDLRKKVIEAIPDGRGGPHDQRQDAGRRDMEAVPGHGPARRDAGQEGPELAEAYARPRRRMTNRS